MNGAYLDVLMYSECFYKCFSCMINKIKILNLKEKTKHRGGRETGGEYKLEKERVETQRESDKE